MAVASDFEVPFVSEYSWASGPVSDSEAHSHVGVASGSGKSKKDVSYSKHG